MVLPEISVDLSSIDFNARGPGKKGLAYYERFSDVPETIEVSSQDFKLNEPIPAQDSDVSPHLKWTSHPDAVEYVIIIEDPDTPLPVALCHGSVIGIPPSVTEIKKGDMNKGGPYGRGLGLCNKQGYIAPGPPPGHGKHRYFFQVYALNSKLNRDPEETTVHQILDGMKGKVCAKGMYFGTFERLK